MFCSSAQDVAWFSPVNKLYTHSCQKETCIILFSEIKYTLKTWQKGHGL